jgi:8-oxo-dGTP pyrophosphatase MutT (NUDIX family)
MTREHDLRDELQAYRPSSEEEQGHRRAMLTLLDEGRHSFSRAAFEPGHFTASCYIVDREGRLLLHHHRRLNRWLQMGGHVEAEEAPAIAALREGREESGLADLQLATDGILDLDIHRIPAGKGEPDHDHFDVRYLAQTSHPDALMLDRDESNDLAWVTLDRARELMSGPESHRVIEKIDRLLRERSLP